MRRAAKVDTNQPLVVEALRKIGARVYHLKKPLDLLVGYRGRNILMEVKNADGLDRLTQEQIDFIAMWSGEIHIVHTVEEALTAVLGKEVMA